MKVRNRIMTNLNGRQLTDADKYIAEAQAEVSFAAGKQEGEREVCEWIESRKGLGENNPDTVYLGPSWQEFKESNGIA